MEQEQQIPSNDFNLAESYLLGNLSAAERSSFEARLATDTALQQLTNELRLTIAGIQEAALVRDMNEFHTAFNNKKTITTKRKSLVPNWLAAAAVLLLLVGASWMFFFRESANEQLFATYYRAEPGLITAMSTSDNYRFDKAMVDYKTGDYKNAITAWESLLKTKPGNDTLNYFIGSAWMALKDDTRAKPYLQQVVADANSYFIEDAYWYLGLILLKEEKTTDAIALIEKSNHPDKEKLLLQLRKK